jgi:hypothetical protein
MKRTASVLALLCAIAITSFAADKRQLTKEEIQTAYNATVLYISSELLGEYSSPHYAPMEQTSFTPGWSHSTLVRIDVDSKNPVGILLKRQFRCRVWGSPQSPMVDISYGVALRETK